MDNVRHGFCEVLKFLSSLLASCEKCTSTGRKCDGYEDNVLETQPAARSRASNAGITQPKPSRARALVPVSAAAATAQPYSVSWLPFYGGELQKRNFDFFQSVTSSALSSFYGSEFWSQETLQVAHEYPALFHAITAFGSIHHSYLSDETPSDVPRIGTNNHIEFGLSEFNKAIKSMSALMTQKELSRHDQQAILTTCVLFTGLSSLQGRQSQAFMHVKNGLRMIHHWRLNHRMITPDEKNAVDMLLLTFIQLDSQIRPYLVGQESLLQWTDEDIVGALSPQRTFQAIFEAYFDLEILFNKLLRLNFNAYSFKQLSMEIELLKNQGDIWDRQFAHLLSTMKPTASDLDALDFIQLRREYVRGILSCLVINAEDNVHDDLIPIYQAIIDLSQSVLRKDGYTPRHGVPDSQKLEHPIFVLGSTIIEPLFFTATRCREPALRRRALYLLRLCPRREGICEGMMAAKIVQKVIEVEEQECPRCIDWHNNHPSPASITTTAPSSRPTPPSPQFLPIRTSPHSQNNNFRVTSESINVILNHLDIPTSPLNYPTAPKTGVAMTAATKSRVAARKSQCSEKGKWVCEKHRVVETQFLLFTERQIKIVIWTGEDCELSRKGREMVLTWW
ncbi:hypothetical protein ZTR_06017 [Talaromyces verruculosus]|nr:hypothetical protein ZTR_06017 [Talaromyces verruculosus]